MSTGDLRGRASSFWSLRKRDRKVDKGSDSSSDEEDERHDDQQGREFSSPPPAKRRHLASAEVGRFADMSLLCTTTPSEVIVPPSPPFQGGACAEGASLVPCDLEELTASAVEEPADDEVDMRARRGPNTIQLDKDRFYVTSLSDSSSDEEDTMNDKERRRVDSILSRRRTDEDEAELRRAAQDPAEDEAFLINGELLSRLQIMDWHRRQGVQAEKSAAALLATKAMDSGDGNSNSLIVWRKPDDIRTDFGYKTLPLVHEDGAYAFVQRPVNDGMDVD